jgi:anti-sigma regulatory factor (Ser/Thr protein kinase)
MCQPSAAGLLVRVRDQGKGFAVPKTPRMPSPDAPGGRGLPLMCALADSVEIAAGKRGTTVTLKMGPEEPEC